MDTHHSPIEPRLLCPEIATKTKGGNPGQSVRLAEMFSSSQGEGELAGTPSVFIRFSGCNLRCWFCDTPYASFHPEGANHTVEAIAEAARQTGITHAVITGGEPFLQPSLSELTHRLNALGFHITIETAGTLFREVTCDLMSLSPKLASSRPKPEQATATRRTLHDELRWRPDVIRRLMTVGARWQLKFVVESPQDCEEVESALDGIRTVDSTVGIWIDPGKVWLMPEALTVERLDACRRWLEPYCRERGYRYCDRYQLRWYGSKRGT